MNSTDDPQFADSDGLCEVVITDVKDNEYVYWVKIADLGYQDDVEYEALTAAVAFHKSTVGTDVAIDDVNGGVKGSQLTAA